jgi:FixJ family two-component response regulator
MSTGEFVTFLVDDDKSVLKSVSRLLKVSGFEVRAYCEGRRFLDEHDPHVPGCIILDLSLSDMSGLEIQQELATTHTDQPIIFLSGTAKIPASVKALKSGAIDFLTKPAKSSDLLAAISAARETQITARTHRDQIDGIAARLTKLTVREREVLNGVVSGLMNKQIADELGIALKTVKSHRGKMMQKMEVRTVAQLVRMTERVPLR